MLFRSECLVIPVQAPGMHAYDLPKILAQFKAERLRDDSDDAIRTLAHRIVRDASAAQAAAASAPVSSPIMLDAIETLSDLPLRRLDRMRWLLVDEGLDAVEQALDHDDENALLAATADLELLSPSRVSRPGSHNMVDIPLGTLDRVTALIGRLDGRLRSAGEGSRSS